LSVVPLMQNDSAVSEIRNPQTLWITAPKALQSTANLLGGLSAAELAC